MAAASVHNAQPTQVPVDDDAAQPVTSDSIDKPPPTTTHTLDGTTATTDKASSTRSSADLQLAAAAFLETTEAQLAIVLLIALDVCSTTLQMHLRDQHDIERLRALVAANDTATAQPHSTSLLLLLATRVVESFTGFTVVCFVLELAVLAAAFRRAFFTHVGYVTDLAVVAAAAVYEIVTQSKALRLLGIVRCWRVLRLVNTLLERERRAHDATRDALEREQLQSIALATEHRAARASLEREYASRDALAQQLQHYKDDVATLEEALHIAADAVAEAELQAYGAHATAPEEASGEATAYDAVEQASEAYEQTSDYDGYSYNDLYTTLEVDAQSVHEEPSSDSVEDTARSAEVTLAERDAMLEQLQSTTPQDDVDADEPHAVEEVVREVGAGGDEFCDAPEE